jgi:competence protein ComEC
MRSWMIAASIGIAVAGFVPSVPAFPFIVLLGCSSLLLHLLLYQLPHLRLLAALLAGMCWGLYWAHSTLDQLWPETERQQDILVEGSIWSLPKRTEQGWRFELRLSGICSSDTAVSCEDLDTTRAGQVVLLSIYEALVLEPGQHWRLLLRLQRPHGMANPGSFDYEIWLLQQDIVATGYVRSTGLNQRLASVTSRPWFNRLRFWLSQLVIQADTGEWHWRSLLIALTLGDMNGIGVAEWQLYTDFGLNHLIVISGFHIGLVATLMFHCGLWLSRGSCWLLLGVTAPRFAALCALAAAFCYTGLAGFNLPAVRSLVMVLVYLGGILLDRHTQSFNSLSLALLLALLFDPLAPQSPSFWLSFVAVAILLSQAQAQTGTLPVRLWQTVRLQFLLCFGMLPVMLVFFQQSSVLAPLVNLLAIPYVGLLVVPLALLALVLLTFWPAAGQILLSLCDWLLQGFMLALQWLAHLDIEPLVTLPLPSLPLFLILLVLTALLLLHRKVWVKLGSLVLLPVILLVPRAALKPGQLHMTVFDVGQGLAILISTPHQHLLYDTGPRYSISFDAGSDVLLPALRSAGVKHLDQVIVSHSDSDHAGGLPAMELAYPEARYLSSDTGIFKDGIKSESCGGQHWNIDGISFSVLHPDNGTYSTNDSSCVLLIDTGSIQLLLPGDIEREVEASLLQRYPDLQADVLIAPHHGSKTSSSWPFLKRLKPQQVIYSAGFRNRFGHPARVVQERYRILGVKAFNTAYSGAISITIEPGEDSPRITEYRRQNPRFWYQLP